MPNIVLCLQRLQLQNYIGVFLRRRNALPLERDPKGSSVEMKAQSSLQGDQPRGSWVLSDRPVWFNAFKLAATTKPKAFILGRFTNEQYFSGNY